MASALVTLASTPANLQEALEAQRSLVAESPRDAALLNDLGNLLALAGELDEAAEIYRQALVLSPNDVTSLYNLALVELEQGQTKDARNTLLSIVEMEPRHAWAHYQLGSLYAEQKNRSKAVQHYAEAFSADSTLTSPKVNPHIVENRLATEALLQMHVDESPSTQAPRIYKEPGNVAEMLLPAAAPEPAAEPAVEAAPEAEDNAEARRFRASFPAISEENLPAGGSEPPESHAAGSPVDTGSSSRAAGTAGVTSNVSPSKASRTEGSSGTEYSQDFPRQIDDAAVETQPTEPLGPADRGSSQDLGNAVGMPGGFTPGIQSTGRLELELVPAESPAPTVSST